MKKQETLSFQSEVKQLLKLMIHSLYSNKEIFLRELISNASDAADKLRFSALSNQELYENDADLYVRISVDKKNNTLTVSDNCIGMSRIEVINNLGTIAKSGTKAFLESLGSDLSKNNQMIGQFGVGFYSVFIVAEKVIVRSRAAGFPINQGVFWESSGEGEYTIADIEKSSRGTEIILYLRKNEEEFLDNWRLRSIIGKYSDHISLSVEIKNDKDNNVIWEKVNQAKALWTRSKSEISESEYIEFYKHISHDNSSPLIWTHNHVEGKQEYIILLFIPSKASFDLWNRDQKHGLKLYVQRVYIMDDVKQFIPNYLRFVRGIIDCNDLPLNVSREILQDNLLARNLRNALTKRVLHLLDKLAKEDIEKYQVFWQQFGIVIKEGPAEDSSNNIFISKLLRFTTTHTNSSIQNVSLKDYVSRMIEGQNKIFYITADSYTAAKSSPHLELFNKKGIEVLLLSDRTDEWMMSYLSEFDGKKFQSITKSDELLDKLANEDKKLEQEIISKDLEDFVKRVKILLADRVKNVKLTNRLTDTPAIVTTDSNEMTTQMAKLFVAVGQNVPEIKYNFELNPNHRLVQKVSKIVDKTLFSDWIEVFFGEALLAERGVLEDPNLFIQRLNKLF
ncbi:Chaperone protein HtpG [Candidatus Providencia siddallii]|uniref:Chaperone protein HtpG n=1 Tax=Candidatus Providencia siddallii TaxID=1715285 RepID=A0A0M6W957_9GAMM|nr:Chaperone protein HtpG [Candidatus Providencia siddallii]